jgi:hypothetical protein
MDGCEHVLFSEIIILTLILNVVNFTTVCRWISFISSKVDTNMMQIAVTIWTYWVYVCLIYRSCTTRYSICGLIIFPIEIMFLRFLY